MSSVSELLQAEDALPISPGVALRVKFADPVVRGTSGAGKEWAFMPMKVEDQTGVIKLLWWNPAEIAPAAMLGKTVMLRADKNGRGQLGGCNIKHRANRAGDMEVQIHADGHHLTVKEFDVWASNFPGTEAVQQQQQQAVASAPVASGGPTQLSTRTSPLAEVPSELALLRAMEAWAPRLREMLFPASELEKGHFEETQGPTIASCLNTLVIAATSGKLKLEPSPAEALRDKRKDAVAPRVEPEDKLGDALGMDDVPFALLVGTVLLPFLSLMA